MALSQSGIIEEAPIVNLRENKPIKVTKKVFPKNKIRKRGNSQPRL